MHPLLRRLSTSTVVWSWGFNCLRLASGLLLLPLLLRLLPKADLGMYYAFLSLTAIVMVLDLGFSPTIGRFITYAMGGARKLTAQGVAHEGTAGEPNLPLLWELLETARVFYRFLVLAAVGLLGSAGSLLVWQKAGETSSVTVTWLAWGIAVAGVAMETYFSVWNIFLRNINQVLAATRIGILAYAARLGLTCVLLLCGGGLLSLPIASLVTSVLIRNLSRRLCLAALKGCPRPQTVDWRAHFRTIWPNGWRLGLHLAGFYLTTNANVLLCSGVLGLEANAQYGLSLQIVNMISGMSAVWTAVKWPLVGQFIARKEIDRLRQVFWPRFWLQMGTHVALAAFAVLVGPALIQLIGSDKQMLPVLWMSLFVLYGLLEAHCHAWNTLINMWNQLPMLWWFLASNAIGLGLNVVLIHLPDAHPGLLVLGPLLASGAVNYWYWPRYGARTLGLSWLGFLRYGFARLRHGGASAQQA